MNQIIKEHKAKKLAKLVEQRDIWEREPDRYFGAIINDNPECEIQVRLPKSVMMSALDEIIDELKKDMA